MTDNKTDKRLGFGLMRLPSTEDGAIDLSRVRRMADRFLDCGFRYFDTAYPYHGGKSEPAVKEILTSRRRRDEFRLATKLPVSQVNERDDAARIFAEQQDRTGTDWFDCYLLHAVDQGKLERMDRCGLWDFLYDLKKRGLAKEIGFSFHDTAPVLDRILAAHPDVDFVQLQINYADWDDPSVQSRACWETARKHGREVIVMEPVKGGMLADIRNPDIANILKDAAPDATISSWALRFAASLDGVRMVLSGMSTEAQLEENMRLMSDFQPLTDMERAVVTRTAEAMRNTPGVPCTRCGYCLNDCPAELPVPNLLGVLNSYRIFGKTPGVQSSYDWYSRRKKPSDCLDCGGCETRCPQHLPIRKYLAELSELFPE